MTEVDRFSGPEPVTVLIFTSPMAGSGAGRERIPLLVRRADQAGAHAVIVHSAKELQERALAANGSAVVVAAGGDGTLSLAAASVSAEVPIVPMPLGTENLVSRQFGHTVDEKAVLDSIRHGPSFRLDAGLANGRLFLIMASCGFDAEVVRGLHLTRSGHISRLSYAGPIARAIRKYKFPKIRIRIDGRASELPDCGWAMVFNLPRYGANLAIEPAAIGDDGKLDLIGFQRGSVLSGLRYAAAIAFRRHTRFQDVHRQRGVAFELTSSERVPYQIDGDYVGRLPLNIETLRGRVCLLLPRKRFG